jgi:branched-chain amino acid transport system substrate-binding protein
MKRRLLVQSAAAACIAGPSLFAKAQQGSAGKKIVLGQSAAFSGPASALGEKFKQGALLQFDKANAHGGVGGRLIELKSMDDGYEPDRCAANTKAFIEQGVSALFGYIGTPTSLAALPLVTAAKMPFIAPFTGAEALRTPFNRQVFHVRASYFDETAEIVKQLLAVGIKRIAVFHQNDSYGKAGLEGVTRALKPHDLAPTGLGTVERNTTAVDDAVKAILSSKPDAIVQISAYKSCAAFIRAARKAGFGGSQVMPGPFTPVTALSGEYLAAGRAAQGDKFEPNYSSMEGYAAAKVLLEALRRGGTGPDALIQGLEAMHDFNAGGFFLDFNPQKHSGSKFVELTILQDDGRVRR